MACQDLTILGKRLDIVNEFHIYRLTAGEADPIVRISDKYVRLASWPSIIICPGLKN